MRHLIIGAGATLAEALDHGCPPEFQPPLIRDFARKTWMNYSPHPVLEASSTNLGMPTSEMTLANSSIGLKRRVESTLRDSWSLPG